MLASTPVSDPDGQGDIDRAPAGYAAGDIEESNESCEHEVSSCSKEESSFLWVEDSF